MLLTFPFVGLISIQQFGRVAFLIEEEAQSKNVADWQPKVQVTVVFVLFHEEISSEKEKKENKNPDLSND